MSTARAMSTARVTSKAWAKEGKAKAKDQVWRRNRHPTRASRVTAGRVASGATERESAGKGLFVQGVEELPSSSSGSTARSAGITTAAARTAVVIHEAVNDEDETGWIFGVTSGSAVATYRDVVWDELVLDSGSVSADVGVNDKEKTYLQDIQQRRIPSHGWSSGALKETSSEWSSSTWQTWRTRWSRSGK